MTNVAFVNESWPTRDAEIWPTSMANLVIHVR
jgi:hypothetical protein